MIVDIGNPIVGVDVVEVEEVEYVCSQPYVAEVLGKASAILPLLVVQEAVGHS